MPGSLTSGFLWSRWRENVLPRERFYWFCNNGNPYASMFCRSDVVHAPNQWETTLLYSVVFHWLGAYTKWSLILLQVSIKFQIINTKYCCPAPNEWNSTVHIWLLIFIIRHNFSPCVSKPLILISVTSTLMFNKICSQMHDFNWTQMFYLRVLPCKRFWCNPATFFLSECSVTWMGLLYVGSSTENVTVRLQMNKIQPVVFGMLIYTIRNTTGVAM